MNEERWIVFNELYCDVEALQYFNSKEETKKEFESRKQSGLREDERVILAEILEAKKN